MKTLWPVVLVMAVVLGWNHFYGEDDGSSNLRDDSGLPASIDVDWQSGQQVQGAGEVIRILPDDTDGNRHQRFIVKLHSGRTLLIAHNIDIAPRVPSLGIGDKVYFNGEYEWNNKGGVIHWTHRDPRQQHQAGWIEHEGRRYQ